MNRFHYKWMVWVIVIALFFITGCGTKGSPDDDKSSSTDKITKTFEGQGTSFTDTFEFAGGMVEFEITYTGSNYLTVGFMSTTKGEIDQLIYFEPGPLQSTKRISNVEPGTYYLNVTVDKIFTGNSEGSWTIKVTGTTTSSKPGDKPDDKTDNLPDAASVKLAATTTTGAAGDGEDSYTLVAQVLDADGYAISGKKVTFSITGNIGLVTVNPPSGTTAENGTLSCTVTDIVDETDTFVITANSDEVTSNEIGVAFSETGTAISVKRVTVSAAVTYGQEADGTDSYTVYGQVFDDSGWPVRGIPISFQCVGNNGLVAINPSVTTTGDDGTASCTVTDVHDADDTVLIFASSNAVESEKLTLSFLKPTEVTTDTATISLSADKDTILADGVSSAVITATLKDANGNPVSKGTPLVFHTTLGKFSNNHNRINTNIISDDGTYQISLMSGEIAGVADVTCSSNGVEQVIRITISGEDVLPPAAYISLNASALSVKTDNSDKTTITATVIDENYVPIEGASVLFSLAPFSGGSDQGQLSASQSVTDASGKVAVDFSCGTVDRSNRTVLVQATSGNAGPVSIPIQITGTTLSLSTNNNSISDQVSSNITATLKDAGGSAIYNQEITFTQSTADGGTYLNIDIDSSNNSTDVYGKVSGNVSVATLPSSSVDVLVTATAMGASGTLTFRVSTAADMFRIESVEELNSANVVIKTYNPLPANKTIYVTKNNKLRVNVSNPNMKNVAFATSIGEWENNSNTYFEDTTMNNSVSGTLVSDRSGKATVTVYELGSTSNPFDKLDVVFTIPSDEAEHIVLQSSAYVLPPTTDATNPSFVTLRASVKSLVDDPDIPGNGNEVPGQPVYNVPVVFTINQSTGGGEIISPSVVFTDESGIAETQFIAGSLSSDAKGVEITASVKGSGLAVDISDTISIVIGGTAGSVTIGSGTAISPDYDDTIYELPVSVVVTDSNGNSVSGAIVSLNLWPQNYATGYHWEYQSTKKEYGISRTCVEPNEDINKNLYLDTVQLISGDIYTEDKNGDGSLTPQNTAGGSIPDIVTTDENGIATFKITYLKAYAHWIQNRLTASTYVYGSEVSSFYQFWLPSSSKEFKEGMLFNAYGYSPYGEVETGLGYRLNKVYSTLYVPYDPTRTTVYQIQGAVIELTATPASIYANTVDTSVIEIYVESENGSVISGGDIEITVNRSDGQTPGIIDSGVPLPYTLTTGADGIARCTYTASNEPGTVTISAAYTDPGNGRVSSNSVNIVQLEPPYSLGITASAPTISFGGNSTITATLLTVDGTPVPDKLITIGVVMYDTEYPDFNTEDYEGTMSAYSGRTNAAGVATFVYTAVDAVTAGAGGFGGGIAEITAYVDDMNTVTATVLVQVN